MYCLEANSNAKTKEMKLSTFKHSKGEIRGGFCSVFGDFLEFVATTAQKVISTNLPICSRMAEQDPHRKGSKWLSMLLRHKANEFGISMSEDGYVLVTDVVRAAPPHIKPFLEIETLRQLVASNAKQRFQLDESDPEHIRIRATQGHSIKTVESAKLCLPIDAEHKMAQSDTIVHGTTLKNWNSIRTAGLARRGRNQIHFAASDDLGRIKSGFRASSEVLIYINIRKAIQDGIPFWLSANGVVLCDGLGEQGLLSPDYFTKVLDVTKDPPVELSLTEDALTENQKNKKKKKEKRKQAKAESKNDDTSDLVDQFDGTSLDS
jgi:2'-phosphotransferase